MKKRLAYLVLPVITLILEIISYGAVCNFAHPATDGSIGHFRELYSFFDLITFGCANFAPLITGILTCFIFLLVLIYCVFGKKRVLSLAKWILLICAITSLCPLFLGIRFFSLVGALITVSIIGEMVWIRRFTNASQNDQ